MEIDRVNKTPKYYKIKRIKWDDLTALNVNILHKRTLSININMDIIGYNVRMK